MENNKKKQVKKLIGMATVTPLAIGSLVVPVNGQVEAASVPEPVKNPTIDWDTFSHDTITLIWDPVANATEYIVERNGVEVYRGPEPRFTDTGLISGATYQYAIYAANEAGVSSPVVDYITTEEVYQSITINWLPIEGAMEYLIERNGIIIDSVDGDTFTYTDDTALLGNTYRYRVIPVDGYGEPQPDDAWDLGDITPHEDNNAPISTEIPTIEVVEGSSQSLDLDNYFSDPDGDVLSYSAVSSNGNASVRVQGDTLIVEGNQEGNSKVLVTARDGKGAIVQRSVDVQVLPKVDSPDPQDPGSDNQAPVKLGIPDQTVKEDETITINLYDYFSDPDGDELYFSVETNNNNTGVHVSGGTLILTGNTAGATSVTVTADDDKGHVVSDTFITTVTEGDSDGGGEVTNRPPTAIAIPDQTVIETKSKTIDLDDFFSDPDGDNLTYNVISDTSYVTTSVSGSELTFTGVKVGQTTVTVIADDGKGGSIERTFDVDVNPLSPDDGDNNPGDDVDNLPISYNMPNIDIAKGSTRTIDLSEYFTDPDGDPLYYNVKLNNGFVSKSINGDVLTLKGEYKGTTRVTVIADDGKGNAVQETFYARVIDSSSNDNPGEEPTNRAPRALTIPDGTIRVDETKGLDLSDFFYDPDGDALTYTVEVDNSNIIKELNRNVLSMKGYREGTSTITITAKDPKGLSVTQTFNMTVEPKEEQQTNYQPIDVIYGEDFVELEWYPIPGAVEYQIYVNEQLAFVQPEDGSPLYYFRADGLDPSVKNTISMVPIAGDGSSLGEIEVPFDLSSFLVNAEVNGNEVTISWDNGDLSPEGYKVVIKDANGNIVDAKEYASGVSEHTAFIENKGEYMAVVTPKVDGEYLDGKAAEFTIEEDYVANHNPELIGELDSITLTLGEEPHVQDIAGLFTDLDGDTLSYEVSTNNTNASAVLDGTKLTVTPNFVGSTIVTLIVKDGKGGELKQQFYVYVKEPVNRAPEATTIPDQVLDITDEPLVFNALDYFTDADGDELTVRVSFVSNNNVGVTSDGQNITITPKKVGSTIVRLVATDDEGATVTQQFNVIVNEVAPESPENLTATALSYKEVQLSFDAVENADEYIILRNGEEIARTALTTYTDNDVQPETTYTYEVVAVNEVGTSEPAQATVDTPAIPKIENLNATVEDQNITLTWDAFGGATRYKIYRYIQLEDGTFQLDNYGQTVSGTTFTDKGLKGSTTYKYEVQPFVDGEFVEESASTVTAQTEEINLAPVASDVPDQEMDVTDEPLVLDVSSYFSDPNGDALTLTVKGVNNENVKVTANGTKLTITPQAVGESTVTLVVTDPEGLSVEETFKVKVNEVAPVAPENLALEALSHEEVKITFDAVSNADKYIILRDGKEIARVSETTYVDDTVQANTSYVYEVVAINEAGQSSPVTGSVTTPNLPTVQNVVATVNGTDITVTWDAMEDSSRYKVQLYKKTADGEYVKEGFARATSDTKYVYTGLEAGEYKIEVIPVVDGIYNADYAGFATAEIDASAIETPNQVTVENIQVTLDGLKANVSFDPLIVDGVTVTKYKIQAYVKDENGEYVRYGYAKATDDVSNNVFELESGKDYKFEVTPRIGWVYDSDYAGFAEISVPADATSNEPVEDGGLSEELSPDEIEIRDVTVTADGTTVTVEWTAQGETTAYRVYRYVLTEDGTYKLDRYAQKVENATKFVDNYNVKENQEYLYVVVPFTNNFYDSSKAVAGVVTTGEKDDPTEGTDNEETINNSVQNVQAAQNGSYVELTWDALVANGQEVTQYRVQRYVQDESGNWVKDGYAPSVTGTSYVDKRAKVGVPYQYKIIPRVGFYDESKAGTVEITLSE
jgi:hypothetical protein